MQETEQHYSIAQEVFTQLCNSTTSTRIPGVNVLPRILSDHQIKKLFTLKVLKYHHEEEGHGGTGHHLSKDKVGMHHFRAEKPHWLPWVASLIWPMVPDIRIGKRRSHSVDSSMQLYRLREGTGVVPKHVDEDFEGPDQTVALCSIILYLNNEYTGGETVFRGNEYAPHCEVGGGLLFRHDLLHEGLNVLSGEKYVLKTDLLFK